MPKYVAKEIQPYNGAKTYGVFRDYQVQRFKVVPFKYLRDLREYFLDPFDLQIVLFSGPYADKDVAEIIAARFNKTPPKLAGDGPPPTDSDVRKKGRGREALYA